MNEFAKPNMTKAALIGSLVAGIPSGLPGLDILNCICCLWVVSGGILSTSLLQKSTSQPIQYGQGALVGLLTGIGAAVVAGVLRFVSLSVGINTSIWFLQWLIDSFGDQMDPAQLDQMEQAMEAAQFTGVAFVTGLLQSLIAYAIVGTVAGVIGTAIFAKKEPPAGGPVIDATPEPPPAPPSL